MHEPFLKLSSFCSQCFKLKNLIDMEEIYYSMSRYFQNTRGLTVMMASVGCLWRHHSSQPMEMRWLQACEWGCDF